MLPDGSGDAAYYCGWTIIGRAPVSHLIASRDFPTAGSLRRAWCGEIVMVIGLTLNARKARPHCIVCNQRLQQMARIPDQAWSGRSPTMTPLPEGQAR